MAVKEEEAPIGSPSSPNPGDGDGRSDDDGEIIKLHQLRLTTDDESSPKRDSPERGVLATRESPTKKLAVK